jgi:hypothetical protein
MMNSLRNKWLALIPLTGFVFSLLFAVWTSVVALHHLDSEPNLGHRSACCASKSTASTSLSLSVKSEAVATQAKLDQSKPASCCEKVARCGGTMPCCKVLYDLPRELAWFPHLPRTAVPDIALPDLADVSADQFRPPRA